MVDTSAYAMPALVFWAGSGFGRARLEVFEGRRSQAMLGGIGAMLREHGADSN